MPQRSRSEVSSATGLMQRLDSITGEINAVLVALAIGLAVLDLTSFIGMRAWSEIAHAQAAAQVPVQPASVIPGRLDADPLAR